MGMFDKDKEIGLIVTRWVDLNTPFILWDVRILREDYPTDIGLAVQSGMVVSRIDSPDDRYNATTLASAIAAKVREAEAADFPAIVSLAEVKSRFADNKALVLQFLKPYEGPGSKSYRPEVAGAPMAAETDKSKSRRARASDDIPF